MGARSHRCQSCLKVKETKAISMLMMRHQDGAGPSSCGLSRPKQPPYGQASDRVVWPDWVLEKAAMMTVRDATPTSKTTSQGRGCPRNQTCLGPQGIDDHAKLAGIVQSLLVTTAIRRG